MLCDFSASEYHNFAGTKTCIIGTKALLVACPNGMQVTLGLMFTSGTSFFHEHICLDILFLFQEEQFLVQDSACPIVP